MSFRGRTALVIHSVFLIVTFLPLCDEGALSSSLRAQVDFPLALAQCVFLCAYVGSAVKELLPS